MRILANKPAVMLSAALCGFCLLAASFLSPAAAQPQGPKQKQSLASGQRGERIFQENCARCHRPPMTIPTQAAGTIIVHMRVRARLSAQEEKDLLRYLAP